MLGWENHIKPASSTRHVKCAPGLWDLQWPYFDLERRNRRACAPLHYRLSFRGMIAELDSVALTVNLPEHGLTARDVGAVVHVYTGGKRFMVEFTTFDGSTVAVTKVSDAHIRPLSRNEIHHARKFEPIQPIVL